MTHFCVCKTKNLIKTLIYFSVSPAQTDIFKSAFWYNKNLVKAQHPRKRMKCERDRKVDICSALHSDIWGLNCFSFRNQGLSFWKKKCTESKGLEICRMICPVIYRSWSFGFYQCSHFPALDFVCEYFNIRELTNADNEDLFVKQKCAWKSLYSLLVVRVWTDYVFVLVG